MNKQRRKRLAGLFSKIDEVKTELESIIDEEQEALDNLPESLQGSERGETMESILDQLATVVDSLEQASDELSEVTA